MSGTSNSCLTVRIDGVVTVSCCYDLKLILPRSPITSTRKDATTSNDRGPQLHQYRKAASQYSHCKALPRQPIIFKLCNRSWILMVLMFLIVDFFFQVDSGHPCGDFWFSRTWNQILRGSTALRRCNTCIDLLGQEEPILSVKSPLSSVPVTSSHCSSLPLIFLQNKCNTRHDNSNNNKLVIYFPGRRLKEHTIN